MYLPCSTTHCLYGADQHVCAHTAQCLACTILPSGLIPLPHMQGAIPCAPVSLQREARLYAFTSLPLSLICTTQDVRVYCGGSFEVFSKMVDSVIKESGCNDSGCLQHIQLSMSGWMTYVL